jgi:MYXO-CTERM domain-containing protein
VTVALPAYVLHEVADVMTWSPATLGGRIDVVLSDMAPHTSGDRHSDQFHSEELAARALEIGRQALRPGGHLVAKVFQGGRFGELLKAWKSAFQEARPFHCKDTRATSSEQYLIGRGLLKSALLEPPPPDPRGEHGRVTCPVQGFPRARAIDAGAGTAPSSPCRPDPYLRRPHDTTHDLHPRRPRARRPAPRLERRPGRQPELVRRHLRRRPRPSARSCVEGGCTAMCEPVSVQAACAADLRVDCDGMCNAEIEANCDVDCQAGCEGRCDVDPGNFSCAADCQADCSADCSGSCAADSDSARCEASCKATCSGSCDVECSGTPPSADCKASCEASCSGSCQGKANIDCQIDCQADGFAECEAMLEGGCEAQCEKPEGAIFCDGQFVDAGNPAGVHRGAPGRPRHRGLRRGQRQLRGQHLHGRGRGRLLCDADSAGNPALAGLFGLGFLIAARRRRR